MVSTVLLTPEIATTSSTFVVEAIIEDLDIIDADQLSMTYQWSVDGQPIGPDTNSIRNTILNEYVSKGQEVYVVVTPSDQLEDGVPAQSNSTVGVNTEPMMPGILIVSNNNPAEDGVNDLICSIYVESTDVLDTWMCEVIVNAGETDGEVSTAYYDVDTYGGTEIWFHDLTSTLTDSVIIDGAWNGHGPSNVYGRMAWFQESDRNRFYIPVGRTTSDFEAVEIDVYVPDHSSFYMEPLDAKYGYNGKSDFISLHCI